MSTDRYAGKPAGPGLACATTWILGAVAALGSSCGVTSAAEVRFVPAVDASLYHDGNVQVVKEQAESDEVLRIGANLSLSVATPSTKFSSTYSPYHESFFSYSELDNTSHEVSLSLDHEFSRRSELRTILGASRSDRQNVRSAQPEDPVTLVPRTRQDRVNLALDGTVGAGRQSFFEWGADADLTDFPEDDAGTRRFRTTIPWARRRGGGWRSVRRPGSADAFARGG